MLFRILLRYIFGYVNISVEGYYIERFINSCLSKNILIWNVKREKSTYMKTNIGIKDFKKIKDISKRTKCKIKIEQKKGIPFLMNRYRKRKLFAALLIIMIIIMIIASKFVWNIEIQGLENIEKDEILKDLVECGLSVGTRKNAINSNEIINKIRLNRDDVAWMNIDMKGTNVIVKIVETTKKPDIVNSNEFCNIVSNKKAQILKITAKNGTILVKPGDIVTENTILIGGWMEGKFTGIRYVHAARRY